MGNSNDRHTAVVKPSGKASAGGLRPVTLLLVALPLLALGLAGVYLVTLPGEEEPPPIEYPTARERPVQQERAVEPAGEGARTVAPVGESGRSPAIERPVVPVEAPAVEIAPVENVPVERQKEIQAFERAREPVDLDVRDGKQIENTMGTGLEPPPVDLPTKRFDIERDDSVPGARDGREGESGVGPRSEVPEGPWRRGALAGLPSVAPPTPWLVLSHSQPLSRIAIGSCLAQSKPQPIWDDVLALSPLPDLFLMIGDNVYGDISSPDYRELVGAYRTQGRHDDFSKARAAMSFLATWDDHDYGANDAGMEFPHKVAAATFFFDYWQIDTGRVAGGGIYYAKMIGPPGRRVHIIMLDTRSFRSELLKKSGPLPYWGRYQPNTDPSATMLGRGQWDWLEAELRRPAELRLVVSSVQVLANGHGFERWGNLPVERARLLDVLVGERRVPTILLSGDRHMGAFYEAELANGAVLAEITASSLNRSYGPSKDLRGRELVSDLYHKENFALIDIDWEQAQVKLSLRGLGGEIFHSAGYKFSRLAGRALVNGPGSAH